MDKLLEEIIFKLYQLPENELTNEKLHDVKKEITRKYSVKDLPTNIQLQKKYQQLVNEGKIPPHGKIKFLLMKRKIRSLSGIVPIQVLTKPWPCPGKCIFCPNETIMPKSYISTEPGAMRALLNEFDPLKQTYNRLLSLQATGHNTDKIEMIVLWGSFDAYPMDYKIDFIKKLYDACNTFDEIKDQLQVDAKNPKESRFTIDLDKLDIKLSSSLEEAQKINETAKNRIIWLTIETRPDLVTEKNIQFRRKLWVTRIEIWIQSCFDDVLKANKRGHTLEDVKKALHLIRKYWLKISAHMMPGLYKSNVEKDIESFRILYSDPYLKPDELKFYPTSVIPNTELYQLYKKWEYKPITDEEIKKVIYEVKSKIIPPYTRIKRLIRDIPATEIVAWSNITNLRQLVLNELKSKKTEIDEYLKNRLWGSNELINTTIYEMKDGYLQDISEKDFKNIDFKNIDFKEISPDKVWDFVCICTRCREIRNKRDVGRWNQKMSKDKVILVIRKYLSSVGEEYFISFETFDWYLIGFVRLLLPKNDYADWEGLWPNTAIVRELHVYGMQEKIGKKGEQIQHKWFGKKLMWMAEKIAAENGYNKLSVISWVGVRWFYKKIRYELEWTYMVKSMIND